MSTKARVALAATLVVAAVVAMAVLANRGGPSATTAGAAASVSTAATGSPASTTVPGTGRLTTATSATRRTTTSAPARTTTPPRPTTTRPKGTTTVPPGMGTIARSELPREGRTTLDLIAKGGPFPYRQDGVVFGNREGHLPKHASGYYHEYTVVTPGSPDRGARRIITGGDGERYYTADHYDSFRYVIDG